MITYVFLNVITKRSFELRIDISRWKSNKSFFISFNEAHNF